MHKAWSITGFGRIIDLWGMTVEYRCCDRTKRWL